MRKTLLFLFCSVISLTASAQWWKLKKRVRQLDTIQLPAAPKLKLVLTALVPPHPHLVLYNLSPSDVNLEARQSVVMKTAQHNMRFRIYTDASYNFRDLAQLYVQQGRYSEAKWYFLQSTFLARQQNNHKLTFANLLKLAMVKTEIGDFALAQQDLLEARNLATYQGWLIELIEVEKKLSYIQHSRFATLRDKRYADEIADDN